jgi:hypothetical protein
MNIKRTTALIVVCAGVVAIGTLMRMFAQGTAPVHRRTVGYVTGRPIVSLIKPGDAELTVVGVTSPQLRVLAPQGTSEIEWEGHLADVILRIRVTGTQAAITARGDWVTSTVSGQIKEVLKPSSKTTFAIDQQVSFAMDGGDVTLAMPGSAFPIRVHADVPWAMPFQTGVEYLAFGWLPTSDQLLVGLDAAYELTTDGYVRSLVRDRPADEINGALASDVLTKLRSVSLVAGR